MKQGLHHFKGSFSLTIRITDKIAQTGGKKDIKVDYRVYIFAVTENVGLNFFHQLFATFFQIRLASYVVSYPEGFRRGAPVWALKLCAQINEKQLRKISFIQISDGRIFIAIISKYCFVSCFYFLPWTGVSCAFYTLSWILTFHKHF